MKKYLLWGLAALLLLSGCQPPIPSAFPTPSLTHTPPPETESPPPLATPAETQLVPAPTPAVTPPARVVRVLIISIDGLRPEAISLAPMPNLQALLERGRYSLSAQTIYPSSTLPAHASMISGMCPEKHGVDWNDYRPERGYAAGRGLFDIAHAAGLRTVMVVGKEKLQQIAAPESVDVFDFVNDRDSVVAAHATRYIAEGFGVLFVHLPLVDILGHEYGWLSPDQLIGAKHADEAIGILLAALDEAGLRDETAIIVTADHGGVGTSHGGKDSAMTTIPWVLAHSSLRPGVISFPVSVTDTAPTAASALGLPLPDDWDGISLWEEDAKRDALPCQ